MGRIVLFPDKEEIALIAKVEVTGDAAARTPLKDDFGEWGSRREKYSARLRLERNRLLVVD